ncbi:MAG: alpha/beta hydrolase [Anaerolineae bacterium]|nr:alpha/beta hydrolase [Anaerolineae bacterium]
MPQPLIELGGDAELPTLHLALANGFVPQTYLPLLRHFTSAYHALCLPPRALWGDEPPPPLTPQRNWSELTDDLLAGIADYGLRDVLAFGHSFGGIATLLAALREPQHFRAIVLLDPTILGRKPTQMMEAAQREGRIDEFPLVQAAQRRRSLFDSVEEAYERFRGRSLFAQWSDEAVRLYAEYGTTAQADGTRTLTWPPEWEAYYFSTLYTPIWEQLPKLKNLPVPMLIINGGESDTYVPDTAAEVRQLLPDITHKTISGHGHLFPQSAPDATAQAIQSWLDEVLS